MEYRFRLVSVLFVASLVPTLVLADGHRFATLNADIVAWNLAGFDATSREQVPIFARAMADLDPEVLAIVEVNSDFVAAELVAELNEFGICYRRKILEQTASQNIAVLHKCEVEVANPRLIAGSDDGNNFLRHALAVDVAIGEFDFILVSVHMKAGRGAANRLVRDRQAQAIATFIQSETSGAEQDVLVVGDYNMIPLEDQSNFDAMNPTNFLEFVSSDDLIGQFSHISTTGQGGNLLDGFGISQDNTAEYIAGSLRIFPMHRAFGMTLSEFRTAVSDHLPLTARFRITEDDD